MADLIKGIEISEKYYFEHGAPMIRKKFPMLQGRFAAGLAGEGSECFGYDDEVSRDHDLEPSFCIWLSDEDHERYGFLLDREYSRLPREFMGLKRTNDTPVGGARRGALKLNSFLERFLGSATVPSSPEHWFSIPEYSLASVTNGRIFEDTEGTITRIRKELLKGYPRDIRLKKLASALILAAQSGQYNYRRCLSHNESGAAQNAIFRFVKNALSVIYLINNKYEPFYKWSYRGISENFMLHEQKETLIFLSESGNLPKESKLKCELIESVCKEIGKELYRLELLRSPICDLEAAAYEVNKLIKDGHIRNMHIMSAAPHY